MIEDETKSPGKKAAWQRPVLIFGGFLLIGAALALLFFGGDLFGDGAAADEQGGGTTVLDQVAQIPSISQESAPVSSGLPAVGDRAPNFTLNDLDGKPVSLADFSGRPVIINFWATWCAPCRIEMPELQAVYDKYRDDGLVILALDQDEPADVARAFFYDEMGLTFTPLLDQSSSIANDYGSFGVLPSTYFVDPNGIIVAIHRGPLTQARIVDYLGAMLADNG